MREDAGRRLGEAGVRALKRGDMPATVGLLGRAVDAASARRRARQSSCPSSGSRSARGRHRAVAATPWSAIAGARGRGRRRVELRARIEAAYLRLYRAGGAAHDLLYASPRTPSRCSRRSTTIARSAVRWLLIGYVRGGIHGDHAAWEEAEERALIYYRRTDSRRRLHRPDRGGDLLGADTRAGGIDRCDALLGTRHSDRYGRAASRSVPRWSHRAGGRFAEARELVAEAEPTYRGAGHDRRRRSLRRPCGRRRVPRRRPSSRPSGRCASTARSRALRGPAHLAVSAAELAEALYRQGRFDEARALGRLSRSERGRR